MLYASQLTGSKVWDAWGQEVGRCSDVLVREVETPFPTLAALEVRAPDGATRYIAANQVSGLYPSIILTVPQQQIIDYTPAGDELRLIHQVLDRQIVDIEGRRVVRVNDLQLARVHQRYCLTGVDIGGAGLLRRLGLEGVVTHMARALRRPLPKGVLPWETVAPLQQDDPLRLRISRDKISVLPPADIAAILEDLDQQTGEALARQLDDEVLADAMEEVSADMQVKILTHLDPERAADILEEMAPDEAADLLLDLPEQTSAQLLDLMEDEDAEDVRQLLSYPEDSAGGIMTTEFAWVPDHLTVGQALDHLRQSEEARDDEALYYVYVIDPNQALRGVISLRDLVLSDPHLPITECMEPDPIHVTPLTSQMDTAYLIAKYDLLAIPVVDEADGSMLGIVTVDDAVDAVLPTAWKKRLPRFY